MTSNKQRMAADGHDSLIGVRYMRDGDVAQVHQLMRGLAEFECYVDEFAVTENDVRQRALCDRPEFTVIVAFDDSHPEKLIGSAVCYVIPFTYTMKPELILKELYVGEQGRDRGVGGCLMRAVVDHAKQEGCFRVRWLVMTGNEKARQFYAAGGAVQDPKWENWQLLLSDET